MHLASPPPCARVRFPDAAGRLPQGLAGLQGAQQEAGVHYENFPVASILCSSALRPAVREIYAIARCGDDIADEGDFTTSARLLRLQRLRDFLTSDAFSHQVGDAELERASGLAPQGGAYAPGQSYPVAPLLDLLSAFEHDVRARAGGQWPESLEDVLHYCRYSACPVGRLMLHLYGVADEQALSYSDAICSALQLINLWQDAGADLALGRYYLPMDAMRSLGLSPDALLQGQDGPASQALFAKLCLHAEQMLHSGRPLPGLVQAYLRPRWGRFEAWRCASELRWVIAGGMAILDQMKAQQFRVLQQRPVLGKGKFFALAFSALWGK